MVRARFCYQLVFGRTNTKTTHAARLTLDDNHRFRFHSELSMRLSSQQNVHDPNKHWEHFYRKLRTVILAASSAKYSERLPMILLGIRKTIEGYLQYTLTELLWRFSSSSWWHVQRCRTQRPRPFIFCRPSEVLHTSSSTICDPLYSLSNTHFSWFILVLWFMFVLILFVNHYTLLMMGPVVRFPVNSPQLCQRRPS